MDSFNFEGNQLLRAFIEYEWMLFEWKGYLKPLRAYLIHLIHDRELIPRKDASRWSSIVSTFSEISLMEEENAGSALTQNSRLLSPFV